MDKLDLVPGIAELLTETRQHLHMHPELSFCEARTADYLKQWLRQRNIPYEEGFATHGLVVTLEAPEVTGKYLYLRADMDALPIQEESSQPYRSQEPGVMHACGHDVHMTCLLGAIAIVSEHRHLLQVSVKFIFQPGEEKLPGGATLMLRDKAVIPAEAIGIIALHVHPELEAGKVGFASGPYMASSDELYVEITGKGGHGALPQSCIDPVMIAANILNSAQTLISRMKDPFIPSVLTFGKIYSHGGATNVIPDKVSIEGTFRSMSDDWREELHQHLTDLVEKTAESVGGKATLEIRKGYPVLVNDKAVTEQCRQMAQDELGAANVVQLSPRMTSEDFAWYAREIPGCFFRLGTNQPGRVDYPGLHTPQFDVDEKCLMIGASLLARIALYFRSPA